MGICLFHHGAGEEGPSRPCHVMPKPAERRKEENFSGGGRSRARGWSVFDGVKSPFPSTPETLMAEIDAAIAAAEQAHATTLLSSFAASTPEKADEAAPAAAEEGEDEEGLSDSSPAAAAADGGVTYDARLADKAYKAACAALAAGRPGAALRSLRAALSSCPPDRSSAVSKLRSLVSIASSQQQKQQQNQL